MTRTTASQGGRGAAPAIWSGTLPHRVLIVEDWAHIREGHFPRRFAELAKAYAELGCRVEVLTSRGWLFANEETVDFSIHRYGRLALIVDRVASRLRRLRRKTLVGLLLRSFGNALRVVAIIGSARLLRRRGGGGPADVVVLSFRIDVVLAAALAGPGRWLFYVFEPPFGTTISPRSASRAVDPGQVDEEGSLRGHQLRLLRFVAKTVEQRRHARGGSGRIGTPYQLSRTRWEDVAPFLEPTVLPIAGCRDRDPIPDARGRLGIEPGDRLALLFGTDHNKDCDVVWRVFSHLEGWRLMAGGRVADSYKRADNLLCGREPILFQGFVSNTTRDLAYAAADLVILSFPPDYQQNSGTLLDAISWGIPVVCSERSAAADLVEAYRLGVTFTPGDDQSLANAIRNAPERIAIDDLVRARSELSNRAVAIKHMQLLGAYDAKRNPSS